MHYALLFVAALLAGAVNSVAGGGSLLTFPSLLALGVPPVAANATSTVALVPGSIGAFFGYRDELSGSRRAMLWFALPSLVGGGLGALSVDRVGDRTFGLLVPWLVFGATVLFALQPVVQRFLARSDAASPGWRAPAVVALQLFVALYGGFFGAGIGILMLAMLGFLGVRGMHRMNGIKNFAAVCINGVAAATFVALGRVQWPYAAVMAVGATLGGIGGSGVARRIGEVRVRRIVIAIGCAVGVATLAWQRR